MQAQKKRFLQRFRTALMIWHRKIKKSFSYQHHFIYFLIIFKSEPTPILSLVSALTGFLGPQDIIEYDYSF